MLIICLKYSGQIFSQEIKILDYTCTLTEPIFELFHKIIMSLKELVTPVTEALVAVITLLAVCSGEILDPFNE